MLVARHARTCVQVPLVESFTKFSPAIVLPMTVPPGEMRLLMPDEVAHRVTPRGRVVVAGAPKVGPNVGPNVARVVVVVVVVVVVAATPNGVLEQMQPCGGGGLGHDTNWHWLEL